MGRATTLVYSSPTCMPCKMLKMTLSENGVPFEEISVDTLGEEELEHLSSEYGTRLPIVLPADEMDVPVFSGLQMDLVEKMLIKK